MRAASTSSWFPDDDDPRDSTPIPTEPQLDPGICTQVLKEPETFYLVMIQLTNLPDVNAPLRPRRRQPADRGVRQEDRGIHFAKDVNCVFRITGIQFALRDQRAAQVRSAAARAAKRRRPRQPRLINIGGIQQVVYAQPGRRQARAVVRRIRHSTST
ncbi:MAG: hypothetical protein MZU97_10415 [Bacillus subtilis]|nr:hypothetical protein [Bacillus subtilis]